MEAFALISSRTRLPQAATAIQSLRMFHKQTPIWLCLVDAQLEPQDMLLLKGLDVTLISLDALGIERVYEMAISYTPVELCSSLKPFLIEHLFSQGYESVLFVDSDIYVFQPLDTVFDILTRYTLVLTPHLVKPVLSPALVFGEFRLLQTGTLNLGFIGVSRHIDKTILEWWKWHMRRYCRNDIARGLFFDQRWMDLIAPIVKGVYFLNDPAYNVAFWNLAERSLLYKEGVFWVDGAPLVFFHFSGFEFKDMRPVKEQYPWLDEDTLRQLERLHAFYKQALHSNQFDAYIDIPFGFSRLANGRALDNSIRNTYRNASDQEKGKIGNPFEDASKLIAWLEQGHL